MRDLALIVSAIVLTIFFIGVFAVVTVFKTPRSAIGRTLTFVVNMCGVIAGAWFALLDIGIGARIIGVVVGVISVLSAFRTLREK